MTGRTDRIVIVGAGLAGLRCAQALRTQGHTGPLTLIGDEPHLPYDRPPLSKQYLAGHKPAAGLMLAEADTVPADLRTAVAAVALDRPTRTVTLADGTCLPYDALVIATGAGARAWPEPTPAGVLRLRSLDDAAALRAALGGPGTRLVVVGAGFLGGEIAAAAAALGVRTTLVETRDRPLAHVLGDEAGDFLAGLHRRAGITLHTGVTVGAFLGGERLTGVSLTDGTEIAADVAVLALGMTPHTGWLDGSGLDISAGVRCDAAGRARTVTGDTDPAITAAGDAASWPHPLAGGATVALGHWSSATHHATVVARTLLGHPPASSWPVPSFWSDLHDVRLRSVGLPQLADEVRVLEHDAANRRFEAAYLRAGELIGAMTVNRVQRLTTYRERLQQRLSQTADRQ
jgi:NADPH-dependent 2,4-dienoyl-CoA reductase/sulfur reductase-like enzyme